MQETRDQVLIFRTVHVLESDTATEAYIWHHSRYDSDGTGMICVLPCRRERLKLLSQFSDSAGSEFSAQF